MRSDSQKMQSSSDEAKERVEQCLTDLVGYIDNTFEIAVHFGVPRDTAAMNAKHMYSAVLRLRRLLSLPESVMRHSNNVRARYNIVKETAELFAIEDTDTGVSITNDAEAVVYELVNVHKIGDKRIVYKDTMGNWDELLHDGDQFTGFAPYRKEP